jgi:hypothetical protein
MQPSDVKIGNSDLVMYDRLWLVMMRMDGILETSFPPDDPEKYLNNNYFTYLGIMEELLS